MTRRRDEPAVADRTGENRAVRDNALFFHFEGKSRTRSNGGIRIFFHHPVAWSGPFHSAITSTLTWSVRKRGAQATKILATDRPDSLTPSPRTCDRTPGIRHNAAEIAGMHVAARLGDNHASCTDRRQPSRWLSD